MQRGKWYGSAGRPSQRRRETYPEAGRAPSDCGKERCQGIDRAVDSHGQVVSAHLRFNMQWRYCAQVFTMHASTVAADPNLPLLSSPSGSLHVLICDAVSLYPAYANVNIPACAQVPK